MTSANTERTTARCSRESSSRTWNEVRSQSRAGSSGASPATIGTSDTFAGVDPSGYTHASSVGPSKGVTTNRAPLETVPLTTSVRIAGKGLGCFDEVRHRDVGTIRPTSARP
jgi:hypothetical protein